MGYLSLARFAGDPDQLLRTYQRSEPTMTAVGRDHVLRDVGLAPEQIAREHHHVDHYVLLT